MKKGQKGIRKPKGERIEKALVVFNPVSGLAVMRYGDEKVIRRYLKRKLIDCAFHKTRENRQLDMDKYKDKRFDVIIVAGGDGTVREVAHWMLENNIKTPLAIIPSGTTNVYAMGLGIPLTLRRALRFAVKNKALPQDVGLANKEKYFLFAAGAGYSAKFAKATSRDMKKIIGFPSYLAIAIAESFNKDYITGELITDGDRRQIKTRALVAFNMRSALNINPYFPMEPKPGLLDVLIADEITLANVMRFAKRLTDEKRTIDQRQVKLFRTEKLYFRSDKEELMEIDGDTFRGRELSLEIIPKAINIVCGRYSQK